MLEKKNSRIFQKICLLLLSHNFFLGKKIVFENFGNFENNITYFQSCQGRELFCHEIC